MEQLGPYRLLEVLGRGGMGVVYRAEHEMSGELVALKTVPVPDGTMRASIRREIHALSRIRHPGIVRVVDHGLSDGVPWYAMELLLGKTLRSHNEGGWSVTTVYDERQTPIHRGSEETTVKPIRANGEADSEARANGVNGHRRTGGPEDTERVHRTSSPPPPSPNEALATDEDVTRRRTPRAQHDVADREARIAAIGRQAPSETAREPRQINEKLLAESLTLIRRLCEPLAYLHGRGLVHRDLKPDNVFIRSDGLPVLVDFGIAAHFGGARGRELLDFGGQIIGSPGYMAPEQVRGELVDARADLYALGCMLYEAVTGSTPFAASSTEIILYNQLYRAVQKPSRLVVGLHPELEDLILRLLRKKPQERIGYAEDVAAVLARFGAAGFSTVRAAIIADSTPSVPSIAARSSSIASISISTKGDLDERTGPPSLPMPQPYLYRPQFTGRAEALAALEALVVEASKGRGGSVFVGGASGVGKTRLVVEAATAATAKSLLRVVTGQCVAVGIADAGSDTAVKAAPLHPFQNVLSIIADRARELGPDEAERLFGARAKVLAPYEESLADLPTAGEHPDPLPLPAPAARARILSAMQATLFAYAAVEPLMLVLDDLQWADELSLALVRSFEAETFGKSRLLLVGTYRTEEASAELDEAIVRTGGTVLSIGQLEASSVGDIVRDMLALREPPGQLVDILTRRAGGNPFFVSEYLHAAVSEGLLQRSSAGRWRVGDEDSFPGVLEALIPDVDSLRALVGRRLAALGADATRLVELAAVLGRELDLNLVLSAASLDLASGYEATEELITRHILEEAESGRVRFSHDKLREVAYARIPETERRELHRVAAVAIEGAHADERAYYPILAHHYAMAGAVDKTLDYLEKAGAEALATAAYHEAVGFFSRALGLDTHTTSGARRARLERMIGEAYFSLGDLPASDTHLTRSLAAFGHKVPASPFDRGRALVGQMLTQAKHLFGLGKNVERDAGEIERLRETAIGASVMAFRYYFVNDVIGQLIMSLLSVNQAERAAPAVNVAGPYIWLGYTAGLMRLHGLAHQYFERARSNADAGGDRAGHCFSRSLEAVYRVGYAQWDEAYESLARGNELLRDLDDPQYFELNIVVEAQADFYTGRFSDARRKFGALHASARKRSNHQHIAWGVYGEARDVILRGDLEAGIALMNEAKTLLATTTDRATEMMCSGWLALAHLQRGESSRARTLAGETLDRIKRSPPTVVFTLDGYSLAADVYLSLAEREPRGSAAGLTDKASEAIGELWKFALTFPFGMPALHRARARLDLLRGGKKAKRLLDQSLAAADRLNMPFERARTELALAELPGSDAASHRARAAADVRDLDGAPRFLAVSRHP